MFLYYNARKFVDKVYLNCTLDFEDVLRAYQQYGICEERFWPYTVKNFSRQPPEEAYKNASSHQIIKTFSIEQRLNALIDCLEQGKSIFCGLRFYRSNLMSFHKGAIAKSAYMPNVPTEEYAVFNHAVLLVAYNKERQTFIVRNSLGTQWGNKGYFEVEENYILDSNKAFGFYSTQ